MEDIYVSIIRIAFGIITLAGILWTAMRYMINYKIRNMEDHFRSKVEAFTKDVMDHINTVESSLWDLGIEVTDNTYSIRMLEQDIDRITGTQDGTTTECHSKKRVDNRVRKECPL